MPGTTAAAAPALPFPRHHRSRAAPRHELRRRTQELSQANVRLRQINTDLQRLKESYRDLYHYAPVLYFGLDAQGHFVACNDTLIKTLGYPREALLGQPYTRILPPAAQDVFLRDTDHMQRPGEVETQWVKQDGTIIDVWIGTTTIKDENGEFVRSRSAARDVTERNRLAKALTIKAEELERANGQLRRINQELEDFTYVVSHDLKEPLRTLESFSNFLRPGLRRRCWAAKAWNTSTMLVQACRRLGCLIDDLLTLSRVGKVHPHAAGLFLGRCHRHRPRRPARPDWQAPGSGSGRGGLAGRRGRPAARRCSCCPTWSPTA